MHDLAGRTAVVTGAASGIGRALAAELLDAGCSVAMADVDAATLTTAAGELGEGGRRVVPVVCDVASSGDVEALAAATSAAFGPAHVVCLNAGVSPSGPVLQTSEATWRWLLGVNLLGVVHGLATFGPEMAARGEGHFVVTASATGLVPTPGLGPYSAVKHAVVALADITRQELEGTGVGVSVLCPGVVRTGIAGSERHRPASLPGESHADPDLVARYREAVEASAVGPDVVAKAAVAAVLADRFLVFPTTEVLGMVRSHAEGLCSAVDERAAADGGAGGAGS